jgi:hypothetical protein
MLVPEINTERIYILRIRSLHGDGIHELRHLLKRLLRPHQWRCLSVAVEEEARP